MEAKKDEERAGQGALIDESGPWTGTDTNNVIDRSTVSNPPGYLRERPSTKTAPPADPRMSKAQRWITWRLRKSEGNKKPSKVPDGESNKPEAWTFYHAARAQLEDDKFAGLGFQMFDRPGVVGIDIDNCIDPTGKLSPLAEQFLSILRGGKFHVEISPSGKGLRIFAGETPLPFHDYTNKDTGVEVYTGEAGRFLAFTGRLVEGFGAGPFDPLPAQAVEFLGKHASRWKDGTSRPAAAEPMASTTTTEPVPDLTRREDWEKLHPRAVARLSKEHKEFLASGALGKKYASASEQLFAVEQALLKNLTPAQAFQILVSAEGTWGVALEHREGSTPKARSFIWDDLQRAAVSKEKHEQEKAKESSGWKECEIIVETTDEGTRAKVLQLNIVRAFKLHNEWVKRLGYNIFDGRVTLDGRELTTSDIFELSAWLVGFLRWPMEPRRNDFEDAVSEAAKARPWNPMEKELRGLAWDGRSRIAEFARALSAGTAPGGLALDEQILRKWLVGFVARGIAPGCAMHNVLSLIEREGGAFKTKFCQVMAGGADRFSDSPTFASDKDSSMLRVGMRLIELGEGVAARKSDKHELKKDITKPDDHFRRPYSRDTERRPRGFVYVLTANDFAFLRSDQDGLRRFWPMTARSVIDIEWITANRDQLLAEAVTLFDAGGGLHGKEVWWWDKGNEPIALKIRQLGAVAEDPLDGAVEAVISNEDHAKRGYITFDEIARHVEAHSGMTLNTAQRNQLITVLIKMGMINQGKTWIVEKQKQIRVWRHPSWSKGDAKIIDLTQRTAVGTSGLSGPTSEGVDVGNA